jgi:hypothetical protein
VTEYRIAHDVARAYAKRRRSAPPNKKWSDDQRGDILQRRADGQTYREIGAWLGVSVERVRQIVWETCAAISRRLAIEELGSETARVCWDHIELRRLDAMHSVEEGQPSSRSTTEG